jgi:alpha-tubulin suppressor-like RCC1 family protein
MSLQTKIDNFNSSNTVTDLLQIAAEINANTTNRVIRVATVNDLPDLNNNTIDVGTVFYVESINSPVIAQLGCWTKFNNVEIRNDFDVNILYTWGNGSCGRLGLNLNPSINCLLPTPIPEVVTWDKVFSGVNSSRSFATTSDGTLWSWGSNISGALGINSLDARSSPVSVVGGITNWRSISSSSDRTIGVTTSGVAWAWGCNFCGLLGDGTTIDRSSPVQVCGGFTDWCQVSAGSQHFMGIRTNGTLWGWGCGSCGRIGNGSAPAFVTTPVEVAGNITNWCQVSAGWLNSAAIRTDGTVWAWGNGSNGINGNNCTIDVSSPVLVVGGFTDWCTVGVGRFHMTAMRTNGSAWSWGCNGCGQLGTNTATYSPRSSPLQVAGSFTNWCSLSVGNYGSAALRTTGTLWTWGSNVWGQLGNGTTTCTRSPIQIGTSFSDWCAVAVGANHSMAIRKLP